jgi:hypothetical protein
MASIVRDIVIAAPAEYCWDAVRDFGAVDKRLAAGFVTGVTMTSDRDRQVTFFTGAVATETLVGIDDQAMRLAYKIDDGPMHAAHYNASVQVIPHGAGQSRFVWTVDVLPDELTERTAAAMDAGLAAICATLAGGGTASVAPGEIAGVLERYVAAWHEPDPERRAAAVHLLWDEHGTLVNGIAEYRGWAAVATAITRSHDVWVATGHRFREARQPVSHHNAIRFSWEMVAPDGATVISTGTNVLMLSGDSRILSDYQFTDA